MYRFHFQNVQFEESPIHQYLVENLQQNTVLLWYLLTILKL